MHRHQRKRTKPKTLKWNNLARLHKANLIFSPWRAIFVLHPRRTPHIPPRSPPTLYEMLVPFLSQDIICICLREWEMGEIGERRSVAASYYHITQCHLTHNIVSCVTYYRAPYYHITQWHLTHNIVSRITYHIASYYHITQCWHTVSCITYSLVLPYYPMPLYCLSYYF